MPREMKDSGIEWIGNAPKNWVQKKIKHILIRDEKKNPGNLPVLSVYREYGVIPKDSRTDNHNVTSDDTSNYKYVKPDYLVINKMKAWQGSMGISNYEGIVSPAYFIYRFSDNTVHKKYIHHLFRIVYKDEFKRISTGIREGQWDLPALLFENEKILLPPFEEQKQIADFLDYKCDEIDALHADIEKQIAILEDYKKSIIAEAVTKGLNPDVEMKDSGTEWCPSIPKHWIKTNPKFLFSLRNQKAFPGEQQLTASQKYGIIAQDEFMKIENQQLVTVTKDFSILKHVEPNDFVISMRSFQGGLEYSKLRGCISSAYVMLIPNSKKVYPPFYKWFFKSTKYINALQSTTNLVRDGQAMRYANFIQIPLFIIPISEQQEIADYLDQKTTEIDAIISAKKQQLDVLNNYKKSLIYEYVTGKKEVPSYANAE